MRVGIAAGEAAAYRALLGLWRSLGSGLVGAGLCCQKVFVGLGCTLCTTPDVVVMTRHDRVIEPFAGLRTMAVSAGVLAVLLACAGMAAGAITLQHIEDPATGGIKVMNMLRQKGRHEV